MTTARVYRVFDEAGVLLYVGCTTQPIEKRMRGHEMQSPWWPFYNSVTVEEHATRDEARYAEFTAITAEHPRWNVRDRAFDHPDGPLTNRYSAAWLREEVEIWRERIRINDERQTLERRLRILDRQEGDLSLRVARVVNKRVAP